MHLHQAEEHIGEQSLMPEALGSLISRTTGAVIWLSTWGDSPRMAKEFAAANTSAD